MYVAPQESIPRRTQKFIDLINRVDASAFCKNPQRCGFCTCKTSTFFPKQSQASNQRCQVDARRTTVVDWLEYWGVHAMEWYGLQLRDDLTGGLFLYGNMVHLANISPVGTRQRRTGSGMVTR